jgi:general secretion pathway protein G
MTRPLRRRRLPKDAGVTLIEMLVVVVIIGLIAAIAAINVLPMLDRGRTDKAKADIAQITQGIEIFRLSAGRLPTNEEGLAILARPETGEAVLKQLPNDPWGRAYVYSAPGRDGRAFDLYTLGADGQQGGEGANADLGNW